MYAHVHDQAFRPSSGHPPVQAAPQLNFAASNGSGFAYDAAIYPAIRSTPVSIPKSSSSSLAAALDPAPEPDYNRSPVPPSQLVERAGEQFDPIAFANFGAASSAGDMGFQGNTPSRFMRPDSRQFADPSASSRHQTYQTGRGQNQPISQFVYAQSDMSLPSPSYAQSHQPNPYVRSDDPQWAVSMGFPGYPTSLSHPSAPSTIPSSEYSFFPNDFSYTPTNAGEPRLNVYSNDGPAQGWSYAQPGNSFQASEGMYFDFDQGNTGAGSNAWFGSSVDAQSGLSTEASTPLFGSSLPEQRSDSGSEGQGSSRLSEPDAGSTTLDLDHSSRPPPRVADDSVVSNIQNQYQPSPSRIDESTRQPDTPLQPIPHPSARPSPQITTRLQQSSDPPQLRGHNVLMPPPPLPTRARTSTSERHESPSRTQGALPRRHTVANPPGRIITDENSDSSPALSSATTGARPSSAAPGSSSSSSRGEAGEASPTTPRLATLTLNDAQWAQAQELNRRSLKETYILNHGREPPSKMRIEQTSALERSIKNDQALFASPNEEKGLQTARDGDGDAGGEPPSTDPDQMSEEESFGHLSGDWVVARSPFEARQRPDAPGAPLGSSFTSPISPSTTDEQIPPGAPAVRRPRMNYAYETPANPAIGPPLNNILSVIRHDGHLPSHVSGLGGTFVEAYDGRSYLTDDSEPDPIHLPPCPPGARSGDHPSLETKLPHPLAKRGQTWHDLTNPRKKRTPVESPEQQQEATTETLLEDADKTEGAELSASTEERAALKKLEEEGVKEEEQGEGWGFVEGGSHGPRMALPEKEKVGSGSKQTQRLKLSTEKKTPPKMACHFCRNRKIACGASKCGDPTICNQCERRNIRCIFPTMSRRGMRTKTARSAHTVDGTDEADKDSAVDGASGRNEGSSSAVSSTKKTPKSKKPYEKAPKDKEPTKGKGRSRGNKRSEKPDEQSEDSAHMDASPDVEHINQDSFPDMQEDSPSGHDDPLASLAAEMQWSQTDEISMSATSMHFEPAPAAAFPAPSALSTNSLSGALHFPSSTFEGSFPASIPADAYALQVGAPIGPFTTSPLQRRGQSSTMQS